MAIVLIGFMGAGKSTAAGELARALGVEALDSDTVLEERFGHSVAHEFELHGEEAFREVEEQVVCELLGSASESSVIALGGGSILSERVRKGLRGHVTVLLDVEVDTAWERVQGEAVSNGRPLACDRDAFVALHAERRALYEELANATISQLPPGRIARAASALASLARVPDGVRMLWASSSSGEYPVYIARGLLSGNEPTLGAIWPLERTRSRAFCISDENVAALYGGKLGRLELTKAIPAGEASKTLAVAEGVWEALAASRHDACRSHRRARRRGGRRSGRLLRGHLSARCAGGAGADDAGGPGRLGLRRQDGRRPSAGQELCRRLSPACCGHRRSRHPAERCPRPSWRPAGSRC